MSEGDAFDVDAIGPALEHVDVPASSLEAPEAAQEAADGVDALSPTQEPRSFYGRAWDALRAPVPDTPPSKVTSILDTTATWDQHLTLAIQGITESDTAPVGLHLGIGLAKLVEGLVFGPTAATSTDTGISPNSDQTASEAWMMDPTDPTNPEYEP